MTKPLGGVLFDMFVMPISGHSKSPVEVLVLPLLGGSEEKNFLGWERVRDEL